MSSQKLKIILQQTEFRNRIFFIIEKKFVKRSLIHCFDVSPNILKNNALALLETSILKKYEKFFCTAQFLSAISIMSEYSLFGGVFLKSFIYLILYTHLSI